MPANPFEVKKRENAHFVRIYEKTCVNKRTGQEEKKNYIQADGGLRSNYHGPLKEFHKERFPEAWRAYQNREKVEEMGTPITSLPNIPGEVVEEYGRQNVFSIEELAAVEDKELNRFPLGRKYRDMAKSYLDITNPETQKRQAEKIKEEVEASLLEKLMSDRDALAAIADKAGLAVRKKREAKTA